MAIRRARLTFVWQVYMFHPRHMHLEVALIGEEVLAVADCAVRLIGARAGRLGPVVLVRRWRPFLARLEQLDKGKENNSNLSQFKIATSQKPPIAALANWAVQASKAAPKS